MERKDKFYLHIGSLGVHASRTRTPYVKVISAEGTVSSTCEYEDEVCIGLVVVILFILLIVSITIYDIYIYIIAFVFLPI